MEKYNQMLVEVRVASGLGVGIGVIAGLASGYCASVSRLFKKAYNYFSLKNQKSSKMYYYKQITYAGLITGVTYGKA